MLPSSKILRSLIGAVALISATTVIAFTFKLGVFSEPDFPDEKSEDSVTAPEQPNPAEPDENECFTPVYANMRLQFAAGTVSHLSELQMRGCQGKMTVAFFNELTQKTEYVDQHMEVRPSSRGVMISGTNPVYSNTSVVHPSYQPDNLLFQRQVGGDFELTNCSFNICSPVEVLDYKEL